MIKTTGKEKNYELIEYISDVNTQYTQVLMELNENGAMDAAYTYGVSRLTEDRFTGESNFYLYDPAGNVAASRIRTAIYGSLTATMLSAMQPSEARSMTTSILSIRRAITRISTASI